MSSAIFRMVTPLPKTLLELFRFQGTSSNPFIWWPANKSPLISSKSSNHVVRQFSVSLQRVDSQETLWMVSRHWIFFEEQTYPWKFNKCPYENQWKKSPSQQVQKEYQINIRKVWCHVREWKWKKNRKIIPNHQRRI